MAEKKLTKFAKMKRTERHSCHSKKKKKKIRRIVTRYSLNVLLNFALFGQGSVKSISSDFL